MVFFTEKLAYLPKAALVKWFILDAGAMNDIDTTGEQTLHQVLVWLTRRGVYVAFSCANPPTSALPARYHITKLIGEDRLYPTNRHAIEAYRKETGQATPYTRAE